MNILQATVLGLVQGLAEFLPISSSGHLILARAIMGISDETASTGAFMMLDVLLHAGTLLAVLVVFWKDWWEILKNPFKSKTLLLLFIASVPALLAVVLLGDIVDSFFTGWFLGVSFLITAVFMLIAEAVSRRESKWAEHPGFKHAICMGIMQAIALLPGVSRSGSTLMGGVTSGLNRKSAAKFAFMMSAPAILGSLVFEGKDAIEMGYLAELALVPTIVGVIVSAVSGYLAIRFMLRLINKVSLNWFALYVALLGLVILVLQLAGVPGLPPFALPAVFG
ncbi:MAG: undecaprenyl-diphosphate phosphatase [Clostridia bacterium]|nr:undecaprenyl-diphosphate phosphatase [Clostridia bacterium]